MELESNLNEISSSWNSNFTRKKLAFIGTGLLVATAICISVIVGVKSSSSKAPSTTSLTSFTEKMNSMRGEIKWVSYNSDNYSLTDAFAGGTGSNGKTVYVCRAKHLANNRRDYELIPGTFDPTDSLCKVPYGYKANEHREFDLLVTKNPSQLVWEEESNGGLRNGAISGGHTAYDKELYVARFSNSGYKVLGELYPARKAASGPVGRDETHRQAYQLLCFADFAI
ncbi:uncharacterized protein LOC107362936 [Tetranychus urticae]|uniref:Uncharacterized protein n=1 Tax=Tetranychus urticae TaxID=32264 RepID=T1KCU7_TETUR|nr:uncharacterized protein LOC107362936 [Tetranychus urticae]